MRTKWLLLSIILLTSLHSFSQFQIEYISIENEMETTSIFVKGKDVPVPEENKDLKKITVRCANLLANHKVEFTVGGKTVELKTANKTELDFGINILDKEMVIKHFDATSTEIRTDLIKFRFILEKKEIDIPQGDKGNLSVEGSIDFYLAQYYSHLEITPFGYINPKAKGAEKKIVHVFFDYLGNSLLGTVPSGISNAQYMVHIIYPITLSEPNKVSYSIKQKTGSFSSALLFNNTNIRSNLGSLQGGEKFDKVIERKFLLATSTDDITFDIVAVTKDDKIEKTVLNTYDIKMSPTYHGSFDVGLVKTELSNPTYNLVQLPGSTDQVVKATDESPKGVVTVMASFYVSPIILLESLFDKDKIPFYKLTGRNFLDDHKIYERFYPTIGVGVSDKSFENIFYGINWELARGLSIFGGWHYGKVNTFEMPNFVAGVTPVTSEQFAFYQNNRWKTSTAFGVKLDIMIVRNLFSATSTP
ncbi:hypothetical protein [Flavobacterium sp.]|uniref:hypothetical protein n=1 Tax=Flavobacterium sp. TaxID=239 RepID=UPI0039E62DC9